MAMEIEHKFLLKDDSWRGEITQSTLFKQGYLSNTPLSSVRVRVSDEQAWINIKSATIGTQRQEFEYAIPMADGLELLATLCHKPLIEKTRHLLTHNGHVWEIDEFFGENAGLIVAEIELSTVGEAFDKPTWLGEEVTHDVRYYNNNLCQQPYRNWNTIK